MSKKEKLDLLFKIIVIIIMLYVAMFAYKGMPHKTDATIMSIHKNTEIRNELLKEQNDILNIIVSNQSNPIQIECID